MSDQATIRKIQNFRPSGHVVMIRQEDLEPEIELQSGKIAKALLSESMRSMKTDEAREHFLQDQIETILKQVGKTYQCGEVTFADDGSEGFLLTP